MADIDDELEELFQGTTRRGVRVTFPPVVEEILRAVVEERLLYERTNGVQGRCVSSAKVAAHLKRRGIAEVSSSTIDAWVSRNYNRRSMGSR